MAAPRPVIHQLPTHNKVLPTPAATPLNPNTAISTKVLLVVHQAPALRAQDKMARKASARRCSAELQVDSWDIRLVVACSEL
jgi:hypothetical protein